MGSSFLIWLSQHKITRFKVYDEGCLCSLSSSALPPMPTPTPSQPQNPHQNPPKTMSTSLPHQNQNRSQNTTTTSAPRTSPIPQHPIKPVLGAVSQQADFPDLKT